ncbi:MAG: hypothetical protein ABIX46_00515 [Burkholderiaceae bacterium]
MTLVDLVWHLLDFIAPALGLALLTVLLARIVVPSLRAAGGWRPVVGSMLASLVALVAGLVLFGRDGRIETYAAMVLATAAVLGGVAWRGRRA